ncbi:MAG: hypothetical protein AAB819_02155 [Patescibacteria group bacterium]
MSWQFALVNGKLAEVFFEHKKILGFCYVKASQYKTKKERAWIKSDTQKLHLSYRKKIFRDVETKKIILQTSVRIDPKDCVEMTL